MTLKSSSIALDCGDEQVNLVHDVPAELLNDAIAKHSDKTKFNVNRPDNSDWTQQRLWKWEPMITLSFTINSCIFISFTCFALGVSILLASLNKSTYRVTYDSSTPNKMTGMDGTILKPENCLLNAPEEANSFHADHTCYISITLSRTMRNPVHVFYEIEGFYQNHRRFTSSIIRAQFTDEWSYGPDTDCAPLTHISSTSCKVGQCDARPPMTRMLYPCGIVANTMFNDIFWLHKGMLPNGEILGIKDLDQHNIARRYTAHSTKNPTWNVSLDDYLPIWNNPNMSRIIPSPSAGNHTPHVTSDYTNSTAWVSDPSDLETGSGIGLENEHWRVWVDLAATQPFMKAYGKINRELEKGTVLIFAVQSNFYVRSFEGSKSLVLAKINWFGSENMYLGAFYLGIGAVSFLASVFFAQRLIRNPRALGDASALKWKHKQQ